jgi:threonine synthase
MTSKDFIKNPPNYLEKLVCTNCTHEIDPVQPSTVCIKCGKILFAQYDLEEAKDSVFRETTSSRSYDIWRYSEIMPVKNPKFMYTLGEGWTPLIPITKAFGMNKVFIKDEGQNPTGTFKSRGLAAAVSKACELGITEFTIPTAGNAGAALAAYTTRSGTQAHIYMPETTPQFLQDIVKRLGGRTYQVNGLIDRAGKEVRKAVEQFSWFNVATFREPYRVEGKKTMGIEILEQLDWEVPDVVVYPVGGGTGLIGIWKAINEFEKMGKIKNRPRMVAVQSTGCAPIVKAFEKGKKTAEYWKEPQTVIPGLRVPLAFSDYLILSVLYESNGTAIAVDDSSILKAMKTLAKREGIFLSPEGAATYTALEELFQADFLDKSETVVCLGTGSGFIYPQFWRI